MLSFLKKLKPKTKNNLDGIDEYKKILAAAEQDIKDIKERLKDKNLSRDHIRALKEKEEYALTKYKELKRTPITQELLNTLKSTALERNNSVDKQDTTTQIVATKHKYTTEKYEGLESVSVAGQPTGFDNYKNIQTQNNSNDEDVYTAEEFFTLLVDIDLEIKKVIAELNSGNITKERRSELNILCQNLFKKHNKIKSSGFNWS